MNTHLVPYRIYKHITVQYRLRIDSKMASTCDGAAEQPRRGKKRRAPTITDSAEPHLSLKAIEAAYSGIDGYSIAREAKRQQRLDGIFTDGIQYGEIDCDAFAAALEWCNPQPGETFVDLGSGTGKAVLTAAALYPLASAAGVEIMRPLHNAALRALDNCSGAMHQTTDVFFRCADALDHAWHEYSLVFVSLTCFTDAQVARVAKDAHRLRRGSRLLVTSRTLDCSALKLLRRECLKYGKGKLLFLAYERT